MIFTVELVGNGKLERELWRFRATPCHPADVHLIEIRLQSFELQTRQFTNEAWTIERWWAERGRALTPSRSKRCAKPKITPAIKALAFRMIEREVTWR